MPRYTRRRLSYRKFTPKKFGSQRRARPTREFVLRPALRSPALRHKARRRLKYATHLSAAGMIPHCTRLYAKSLVDPSGEGSKGEILLC